MLILPLCVKNRQTGQSESLLVIGVNPLYTGKAAKKRLLSLGITSRIARYPIAHLFQHRCAPGGWSTHLKELAVPDRL